MGALSNLVHNAVRLGDTEGVAYSYSELANIPLKEARQIILDLVRTFKEATHDKRNNRPHRKSAGSITPLD